MPTTKNNAITREAIRRAEKSEKTGWAAYEVAKAYLRQHHPVLPPKQRFDILNDVTDYLKL
jgi:hypothetical protein